MTILLLIIIIVVFLIVVNVGWMVPMTTRMQLSTLQLRLNVDDNVAAAAAVAPVNTHDDKDDSSWWRQTKNSYYPVRDHPHQGARRINHANGTTTLGMVVDPSIHRLQNQAAASSFSKNSMAACPQSSDNNTIGIEGETGHVVLQRIRDEGSQTILLPTNTTTWSSAPKILCWVYTIHILDGSNPNLDAIVRTWGRQCDGFIAASNLTNHSQGSIDLPHQGPEAYGNMFQKIRSIW